MDLEVVGRHALLFDDDATAEMVNSGGSLVPWAAVGAADLLLDRHDVRHLLDRIPPRPRRPYSAALLSAPSPDGVSEADLDRERFLDLPAREDDGSEVPRDASPSGNGKCTDTGQSVYNAVPFSYGSSAGSDDPNISSSYYHPSFPVPENLLNNLPPSEKVHQIIARTALFVSEHGGQSEIVLRVKQGSNPTFGFLMPDHHLHSYFRYLVDHPQLLKDGADAAEINKGYKSLNSESEIAAPSVGALSLLGAVYESGEEDEGILPVNSKSMDPGHDVTHANGKDQEDPAAIMHEGKEVRKDQAATAAAVTAVKERSFLTKKNPILSGNSTVAAPREKVKDVAVASNTASKLQKTKPSVSERKEVILEPPSFLKRTMEKIVEFILRNGKEFEEKLIEQDRAIGRFPFLLSSNQYHSYYLKILREAHESKLQGRSSERKDSIHGKEGTKSKTRTSTSKDSSASDRSSAEPSEKQLYDKQGKGKFRMVIGGSKKEAPRKVTADEAAAIVMAATRGLSPANAPSNTLNDGQSSSFRSFTSLQSPTVPSKPASNSEAGTSLTSSGQLKKRGTAIIDDDWIANTIAKAAAVAASKEADSSEASMTKEQKLKAERLRRAKMFAAIIKSGGNKMTDLSTTSDSTNEPVKASADLNCSGADSHPLAKEREGSSVPFEHENPNLTRQDKDSDDEHDRVRKYRKKHHTQSDEEKEDSEESSRHSRKRHHSEHSRGYHKHKHRRRSSKDRGSRHHLKRHHSSSEEEREHRSSRSRHHHRDDDHHSEDEGYRSHRHRKDHRSNSKRKREDERDHSESKQGQSEASQGMSDHLIQSEKPPTDTAQSSQATEVPNELRAKIRAMLLETL